MIRIRKSRICATERETELMEMKILIVVESCRDNGAAAVEYPYPEDQVRTSAIWGILILLLNSDVPEEPKSILSMYYD